MKLIPLSATALTVGTSPLLVGGSAAMLNLSAASVTVQGSNDGTNYTTLVTLAATTGQDVPNLPKYVKTSAAVTAGTVFALAD